MRYLKQYEELNDEPEIGDYIVAITLGLLDDPSVVNNVPERVIDIILFMHNNVGKLIKITAGENKYMVKYDLPVELLNKFDPEVDNINSLGIFNLKKVNILFWSSNKEEAEIFMKAKKYNL